MSIDTRTPAEIAYDATRLSPAPAPVQPADELPADIPLGKDEEILLNFLLAQDAQRRQARTAPPAIDAALLAKARGWALAEWDGTTSIGADGALHRSPDLPAQPIATLPDGSPILGSFDTDDSPFTVQAEIGPFLFVACDQVISIHGAGRYVEFTHAQAAALRDIAASGALDQIMAAALAWCKLSDT